MTHLASAKHAKRAKDAGLPVRSEREEPVPAQETHRPKLKIRAAKRAAEARSA